MGTTQAMGMAEAVSDGATNLSTAIEWHLQSNHYPPVPTSMVEPCVAAIMAVADDESERMIDMPDGVSYKGHDQAPAWAVAEQHHLAAFVDQVVGEWVEDEEGNDE